MEKKRFNIPGFAGNFRPCASLLCAAFTLLAGTPLRAAWSGNFSYKTEGSGSARTVTIDGCAPVIQ